MSHFLSNCYISKDDENFLKEFSRDFHQKIIGISELHIFDNILIEWIKNIDKNDKNAKTILELMQYHKFWFTSNIGFFYQHGIGCNNVNKNKALEMYLLAVNDKESSTFQKFTN